MKIRFNTVIQGCRGRELEQGMADLAEWMREEYRMTDSAIEEAVSDALHKALRHSKCTPDYCIHDPACY